MNTNYIELIEQKKKLKKQLYDLDAKRFGATSLQEMTEINDQRKDIFQALAQIEKVLSPEKK